MDEKEFKARASRLEKISKILEKLPTEIRAPAFELLKSYVTAHADQSTKPPSQKTDEINDEDDDATFFSKFAHDKPADNARLIAANHYRKYGSDPFSLEEVRETASAVGVTIPDRADATFVQAQEKGNKLFVRAGRGRFRPTVHGEAYLKEAYSVKKGTQRRSKATE